MKKPKQENWEKSFEQETKDIIFSWHPNFYQAISPRETVKAFIRSLLEDAEAHACYKYEKEIRAEGYKEGYEDAVKSKNK